MPDKFKVLKADKAHPEWAVNQMLEPTAVTATDAETLIRNGTLKRMTEADQKAEQDEIQRRDNQR